MNARLLALALVAVLAAAAACTLASSAADCGGACDKAKACTGLNKTFILDCSPLGSNCAYDVADCADCINKYTCAQLISSPTDGGTDQGACDTLCVPAN
jgi:hypothetical protein